MDNNTFTEAVEVLHRHEQLCSKPARKLLHQLEADARTDLFVISVIGEFKRGKSTLINALLGEDLLQRDVTPKTATVCVLRLSQEPALIVHWSDGNEEPMPLSQTSLQQFTSDADFDPDTVDYLEIGLASDILKHGFVLVDTPGVDDLNQHRSEVACRFVPRSDAVVFVLSAAQPVKKSELEFLKTTILAAGLDQILFVANFADIVDDDIATIVADISRKLAPVLGAIPARVIPFSASAGLQSATTSDIEHLERQLSSGLVELRSSIADLAVSASRIEIRRNRLLHRAQQCTQVFISDIEEDIALSHLDLNKLESDLKAINAAIAAKLERRAQLDSWLEERRAEVLAIISKSIRHFREHVAAHITELVEEYKAPDFKDFVGEKVPRILKQSCKSWVDNYFGPMNALVNTIESRIVEALAGEFEAHVPMLRSKTMLSFPEVGAVVLNADDVSQTQRNAGLLAGGAAAGLLLIHASLFVPVVGLAAFPWLLKRMTDDHLRNAKEKIKAPLKNALEQTLTTFEERVVKVVSDDINTLRRSAEDRYDELMVELRERVSSHIQERTQSKDKNKARVTELETAIADLRVSAAGITAALSELSKGYASGTPPASIHQPG